MNIASHLQLELYEVSVNPEALVQVDRALQEWNIQFVPAVSDLPLHSVLVD